MTAQQMVNVPLCIDDITDDDAKKYLVSANTKLHRAVAGQVRAHWRHLAYTTALTAYGVADTDEHWHQRVFITIWVRFPTRRRRDTQNLYPYVGKPIVDGLVDAQVIPDDDDHHVIGPLMRRDPEVGPLRILISIRDLKAGELG